MPNITVCPGCGKLYEASSEEYANEPRDPLRIAVMRYIPYARWCSACLADEVFISEKLASGKDAK